MAKKPTGPLLVRTTKTCFINNNRYYPGDTLVYRGGGELPEYLEPVEAAVEEQAAEEEPANDALS